MQKMTMNVLLSLIIQSKITGRGMTSNGRLYVMLMEMIADHDNRFKTAEESILNKFNNEVTHHESYRKLERFLSRFVKTGQGYPYELFSFDKFEKSTDYRQFLLAMRRFIDTVIDKEKLDLLVYTLLEIIRQDMSITTILYGDKFIQKERLFGSFAHRKKICAESLLLGLLYHVHINPDTAECVELLEVPKKRSFKVICYSNESSLDLDMPVNLIENIHETASRQKPATMKYQLELSGGDELPESGNIYIYGSGGAGKTTFLRSLMGRNNTVDFYFPLYRYNYEVHDDFSGECCHILLQILLKYHYQYEYDNYNALIANEGKITVLHQLKELDRLMKSTPVNGQPMYTLLLDGMNEMSADMQACFISELEKNCGNWKNVRIFITGRIVPDHKLFDEFRCIEISGVTDNALNNALSENGIILHSENLRETLKNPLFLSLYLEGRVNGKSLNTRGEILDNYVMKRNFSHYENSIISFLVRYALPFVAKSMFIVWFRQEISRGELLKVIDSAYEFYLLNDDVYQNYIAPKKYNKNALLECRANTDLIELIINNTGLLEASESSPHRLHFVHQYYRDYFAARYILNMIDAIETSFEYRGVDKAEMYGETGLNDLWFGGFDCHDGDEVYRLIGEICGDYMNVNGTFKWTLLETLMDSMRDYDSYRTAENVIKTMSIVRNGVICDVNFRALKLPFFMDDNISFSDNGKYPCSFRDCHIPDWSSYNLSFKNCDFTGAKFFNNDYKKILCEQGAILD